MIASANKRKGQYFNLFIVIVFVLAALPMFLYGQDTIITVHDNLDSNIPWLKMLKDNGLLFALDSPIPAWGNISSSYVFYYNIHTIVYYFFDVFTAYIIMWLMSRVVAYASMYLLLRRIFSQGSTNTNKLVALAFSMLPIFPNSMVFASAPFILFAFIKIYTLEPGELDKRVIFLALYPLFSSFGTAGIYILPLWAVGIVVFLIIHKCIHKPLLAAFLALALGYIFSDLKMFYYLFVLREPLNRSLSFSAPQGFSDTFKNVFQYGQYHAASYHWDIIMPVVAIGGVFKIAVHLFDAKAKCKNGKMPLDLTLKSILSRPLVFSAIGVILGSFAYALYSSQKLTYLTNQLLPILSGFNWGRIMQFNRIFWYVAFCDVVSSIYLFNKREIMRGCHGQILRTFVKVIACIIVVLQCAFILTRPGEYNDPIKNVRFHLFGDPASPWYDQALLKKYDSVSQSYITYREFFSEELFDTIKRELEYKGEPVVAFGYHPCVLMYNGFNTIDGYKSVYPLEYMLRFRNLIAPELKINEWARDYYDNWGGRMYLFSGELPFAPTRENPSEPVTLNIDMPTLYDLGGKYVLSRCAIKNADELGLEFLKAFNDEGLYTIYVYMPR